MIRYPNSTTVRRQSAFSLAELLVALSLSAVFFTAAALIYQNIVGNQKRLASVVSLPLGAGTIANLYSIEADTINVYSAPNYGRAAFANNMRVLLYDDIMQSSAVFCLGRNGLNTIRPETISVPEGTVSWLDTPELFRKHLVSVYGSPATDVFVPYAGVSQAEDATIFLMSPSETDTVLQVHAIYEIDIIPVNGQGNYVSVRRYQEGQLSSYYDVFYPQGTGNPFKPMIVHFSRKGLESTLLSWSIGKFMRAKEHPFYFVWWPDPASPYLEAPTPPAPTVADTEPVWDYYKMGGRTSFMFTVPMFPALQ